MVLKLETARTQSLQLWVDRAADGLGGPFVAPPPPPQTLGSDRDGIRAAARYLFGYVPTEPGRRLAAARTAFGRLFLRRHGRRRGAQRHQARDRESSAGCSRLDDVAARGSLDGRRPRRGFPVESAPCEDPATGEARFDQQFWRANISPSERYVLSLPNTLQYRLESGKSGYGNLFLAGDWTKTPDVNVGAVEVAACRVWPPPRPLSGVKIPIVCGTWLYGPPAAAAE